VYHNKRTAHRFLSPKGKGGKKFSSNLTRKDRRRKGPVPKKRAGPQENAELSDSKGVSDLDKGT